MLAFHVSSPDCCGATHTHAASRASDQNAPFCFLNHSVGVVAGFQLAKLPTARGDGYHRLVSMSDRELVDGPSSDDPSQLIRRARPCRSMAGRETRARSTREYEFRLMPAHADSTIVRRPALAALAPLDDSELTGILSANVVSEIVLVVPVCAVALLESLLRIESVWIGCIVVR